MMKVFRMMMLRVFKVARLWIVSHRQYFPTGIQSAQNISQYSLSPSSFCKWWYILKDSRRLEQIGRLRGTVASRAAADSRVLILCKWASSLWVVNEAFTVRAVSPSNMPTIGRRRTEMTGAPLSGEDRHSCMKIAITEQSNFSVMPCYLHKPRVW